ncbi:MAG: FAD-dependent oxidoreductase, partial [Oscillospiraceae bacterium]|nr:FAD-dependent oxidoreductase [Oscillospiraceae bacterium]
GGGVGGMQAALTAAERGHEVTLFEKAPELGGVLAFFGKEDYLKRELIRYRDSQIAKVLKKVDVRLNTEVTREMLKDAGYDVIIVAAGAKQSVPPIPGIDGANVKSAIELGDHSGLGNDVVVIGGGMTGCETTFDLALEGRKVTLVEMTDALFPERDTQTKKYSMPVFVRISRDENVRILRNTLCSEITAEGVKVRHADGTEEFIKADSVVYSAGAKPETKLADELWDCAPDVIPIGDCVKPRFIVDAVSEGFFAAMNI